MKLAGKLRWEFEKENKKVRKRIKKINFTFNHFFFLCLFLGRNRDFLFSYFLVFIINSHL